MLEGLHKNLKFYPGFPIWGLRSAVLSQRVQKGRKAAKNRCRGFMAKHFECPLGLNLRSDRWRGADYWETQATVLSLDDLLERSEIGDCGW